MGWGPSPTGRSAAGGGRKITRSEAIPFTLIGGSGFVGEHLAAALRRQGFSVQIPHRGDKVTARALGHIVYCAGVTGDFARRHGDVIDAHISGVWKTLNGTSWESFLYLSSTRVYDGSASTQEDGELRVRSSDPGHVYNLSKLMGESLCLAAASGAARVVRLSNVFGGASGHNFLSDVLSQAVRTRKIVLRSSLSSERDYVSIGDVVSVLPRIAIGGRHRVYNVASGRNTSTSELLRALTSVIDCEVVVAKEETLRFPTISVARLSQEFAWHPRSVTSAIPELVELHRMHEGSS